MSVSDNDLFWLAGIWDGEGHCGIRLHGGKQRRRHVVQDLSFGLSYRPGIEEALRVVRCIEPNVLGTLYRVEPDGLSRQVGWKFKVTRKAHVHRVGWALYPHLRVKREEMGLLLSFLTRSLGGHTGARHIATDLDLEMCHLSHAIKKGDAQARERARELLLEHPPVQDLALTVDPDVSDWRELRRRGAAIGAIARYAGATHYKVKRVVGDIVPEVEVSAVQLGLCPRPRYPADVSEAEIGRWRALVGSGTSARQVAKMFGRHPQTIVEATCDIRFHQESSDA